MQILNPSTGGLYTGLTNAVSTIYRIEGWRTLWKGVSSVIVGAGTFFDEVSDFLDWTGD
jgi:solute carrier family 25 iron transporter 28/37